MAVPSINRLEPAATCLSPAQSSFTESFYRYSPSSLGSCHLHENRIKTQIQCEKKRQSSNRSPGNHGNSELQLEDPEDPETRAYGSLTACDRFCHRSWLTNPRFTDPARPSLRQKCSKGLLSRKEVGKFTNSGTMFDLGTFDTRNDTEPCCHALQNLHTLVDSTRHLLCDHRCCIF